MEDKKSEKSSLWEWVKAISVLLFIGVVTHKIYITPLNITVDFPTLLSLLLALFSVGLAALFYFKATETSNTFYDKSYNFTKDIAQLLIKIESGFGERLRHLDEGYSSMRDYIQNQDRNSSETVEKTKKKIADEKQEIDKVASERNEIIKHLVEKSQMQQKEKTKVLNELKEKEDELISAQKELTKMNKRLIVERMNKRSLKKRDNGFVRFTKERVLPDMGIKKIKSGNISVIIKLFDNIIDDLPRVYIEDLEREGYFDGELTRDGVSFIRKLLKDV